jgi:curved DNA-binding protein CbpA
MTTRGASAAISSQAREKLVKVLFGQKYSGKGPNQMLDHSMYKYEQLRSAYLERAQLLHPDKHTNSSKSAVEREEATRQFVDLKEAWNRYEDIAKMMKRVSKGDKANANFTIFGVGCSFSDNEAERAFRNEIMDQASRGWFSAGAIPDGSDIRQDKKAEDIRLVDEEFFTPEKHDDSETEITSKKNSTVTAKPRKSLVSHLLHPSRR